MVARAPKEEFRIPPDLLLRAYASGVFPMAEDADDPEVFWIRPETRGLIPLDSFHVPKSLRKTIRRGIFEIRVDSDFDGVIDGCARSAPGRERTWINAPIRQAYRDLFAHGHCHTVEAWHDGALVGGLYGVTFFGESMFSLLPDASKVCLAFLVERLVDRGFTLLDTQFTTGHLKRFGAVDVPRKQYERMLEQALQDQAQFFP